MSTRSGALRLAFVLEAIDKATATVAKVNARIDKLTEPARKVRAAFRNLIDEGRFARIGAAADNVAQRWANVREVLGGVVRGATLVGGALAGAFYGFKRLADGNDRLADTAKMLGISTQELQRLGYAAQMSGSSTEEMGDALRYLSKAKAEALAGNQEMLTWFERVGVSAQQLKKASVSELFGAIGDEFNRVGDTGANAAKKVNVMMALMGRSGATMKQTVEQGSAGLKRLGDEAERLGVVLDAKTLEAMGEFNDSWDRTRLVLFGALSNALAAAAPVLQSILTKITEWTAANRGLMATRFEAWVDRMATRLPAVWDAAGRVVEVLGDLFSGADKVAQALGGWENVFSLVLGLIGAKAVLAIGELVSAVIGLNVALAANPIMAVASALALVVGLLPFAIARFKQLQEAMSKLAPDDYMGRFKEVFVPKWLRSSEEPKDSAAADSSTKQPDQRSGINSAPSWMTWGSGSDAAAPPSAGGAPAPSALGASAVKVGGSLRIEVDDKRTRVTDLKKDPGTGMELDVNYAGAGLAWGG
ncbi:MAG: hypothetical protein J0M20_01350 [Burkholderiales bacterium]|nr:hypothetical protein [Burkholderiales bacterium]